MEIEVRISGPGWFPCRCSPAICRYTWLAKAVRELDVDPRLFGDEDWAMVDLDFRKNMVGSIRFWSLATSMAVVESNGAVRGLTDFALSILGKRGLQLLAETII